MGLPKRREPCWTEMICAFSFPCSSYPGVDNADHRKSLRRSRVPPQDSGLWPEHWKVCGEVSTWRLSSSFLSADGGLLRSRTRQPVSTVLRLQLSRSLSLRQSGFNPAVFTLCSFSPSFQKLEDWFKALSLNQELGIPLPAELDELHQTMSGLYWPKDVSAVQSADPAPNSAEGPPDSACTTKKDT